MVVKVRNNQSAVTASLLIVTMLTRWSGSAAAEGLSSPPPFERNILTDFPAGWHVSVPQATPVITAANCTLLNGHQCLTMTCPPENPGNSDSGYVVVAKHFPIEPFAGQNVRFCAEVRMANLPQQTGTARLWLRVDLPNGGHGYFDNMFNRPITSPKLASYEIVGPVPKDATDIVAGFMGLGASTAIIQNCSLIPIDAATAASDQRKIDHQLDRLDATSIHPIGPQVIDVQQHADVQTITSNRCGYVTFPVPGPTETQVPISTEVTAEPSNSLLGYKLKRRPSTNSWLCIVKVKPPSSGTKITVESLVLTVDSQLHPLPSIQLPIRRSKISADTGAWLKSTACVQSADPLIKQKATVLAADASTVNQYVRNVLMFTSTNQGAPNAPFTQLDAKSGLLCGGSCANRANLFAALVRAAGIPARTESAMPSYFGNTKFYEHWIAQYWTPSTGWVWVEPTLGKSRLDTSSVVVLSTASLSDENRAFDPQHEKYVMPGAPYLSVAELSASLVGTTDDTTDALNSSIALGPVSGNRQEIKHLFNRAALHYPEFEQDETGQVAQHLKALSRHANATELAQAL